MENKNLVHTLETKDADGISFVSFLTLVALVVIVGAAAGFGISKLNKKTATASSQGKPTAQTAGIVDKKTFKDSVEGTLREGGIDGEGNFHLERPGGVSQNVYLTSTTVDLSTYIGKKVKVWGETFQGQTAGWLMDVGLVEVQN